VPTTPQIVGKSPQRKEGKDKVLGRARYVDDIALPGMWFGATVRSSIPRGRITSIKFDPVIPWNEFTIVSAADIPVAVSPYDPFPSDGDMAKQNGTKVVHIWVDKVDHSLSFPGI